MTPELNESNFTVDPKAGSGEYHPEAPANHLKVIGKWAIIAAIVALLAFPIIQRLRGTANSGTDSNMDPASAQVEKSNQLYGAGKYDDAIAAAKEAIKLKPDYGLAYNNMAVSYLQLKKYDEALVNIKEALRVEPSLELAKNNQAWILREQAKANGTTPPGATTADSLIDSSLQQYQAGQYQQCIETAQQALKLNPGMPEAYNNISAAYVKLEMWDKAIENAQLALQGRPNYELARNNLNWALLQKNQAASKKK